MCSHLYAAPGGAEGANPLVKVLSTKETVHKRPADGALRQPALFS